YCNIARHCRLPYRSLRATPLRMRDSHGAIHAIVLSRSVQSFRLFLLFLLILSWMFEARAIWRTSTDKRPPLLRMPSLCVSLSCLSANLPVDAAARAAVMN